MKWCITADAITLQFSRPVEVAPLIAMLKAIGSEDPAQQMALDKLILDLGGNPNREVVYELMQQ